MEKKDVYELTNPQKSIWLTEQYYKGTNINNVCGIADICEEVNFEILKQAINTVIKNNSSFLINFKVEDDRLFQYKVEYKPFDIEVINVASQKDVKILEQNLLSNVFKLENSFLFEFKIYKYTDNKGGFMLNIHHLLADSWTLGLICKKIIETYNCLINNKDLENITSDYFDFCIAESDYLSSSKFEKDREYWENKFETIPEIASMPSVKRNNNKISCKANRKTFELSKKTVSKINLFCKENKASSFNFITAIFSLYISRVCNLDDFVIGTPILNRTDYVQKNTTGMFVSTVPLRINMKNTNSFTELLGEISKESIGMLRHQKYPYEYLLKKLREKEPNLPNLYNVLISYQITKAITDGLKYSTNWAFNGNCADELQIHILDINDTGSLNISYDYKIDKFDEQDIIDLHKRIEHIINQVLSNKDILLNTIDIVTPEEKDEILNTFNNTNIDYPKNKTIVDLFEEQVEKTPNNIAVVFEDKSLTYKELNEKANQLANYLIKNGLKPHTVVGLRINKQLEMIIGIIAIIKCGCCYLPINMQYPEDRVQFMLEDSNCSMLLGCSDSLNELSLSINKVNIELTSQEIYTKHIEKSNLHVTITPEDLIYIIYTSGSTGKPKGAMLCHRNVVRLFKNDKFQFDFNENDVWTMFHSVAFDFSVWEMYGALLFGGKLVLVTDEVAQDPNIFLKLMEKEHVTILNQTPTYFYKLQKAEMSKPNNSLSIRYIVFGGEALKPNLIKPWHIKYPKTKLINMYGITETTVHVTFKELSEQDLESSSSNIGTPIPTLHVIVVDKNLNLLPFGVEGEMCVLGEGVFKGYLNREDLNKTKLIKKSEFSNKNIYRSGDTAIIYKDGHLDYLGRIDTQVKIRGFRIELGEIEEKICEYSNIETCIVSKKIDNNNREILCAYYIKNGPINISNLRIILNKHLPNYMIPQYFIEIEKVPININGKTDYKALPLPNKIQNNKKTIGIRNETDKILIEIYKKALNVQNISIEDSFFELGGDSLTAISLCEIINKKLNTNLKVKDIIEKDILLNLSDYISSNGSNVHIPIIIPTNNKQEEYNLSNAQRRIYYASEIIGERNIVYNTPGALLIDKIVDKNKIIKIFNTIINNHSSFRTCFINNNGEIKQKILDSLTIDIPFYNSSFNNIQAIINDFPQPFDLSKAPLLRVAIHYLDNGSTLLLLDSHHIIMDGFSLSILINEFCELYNGNSVSKEKISYTDYSLWENNYLLSKEGIEAEQYWLNKFKDITITALNLPYDYSVPKVKTYTGNTITQIINPHIFNSYIKCSKTLGVSPNMFFMAAFFVLLYKYTGQNSITIGTPSASRITNELNNTIGMFVNNLCVNAKIAPNDYFTAFLEQLKKQVTNDLTYQGYPIELLTNKLNVNNLFDIMFIYQNSGNKEFYLNDAKAKNFSARCQTAKFNLSLEIIPDEHQINIEYSSELFKKETVISFLQHYLNILNSLVENENINIKSINILSNEEKSLILNKFNNTKSEFPYSKTIIELFEEQVEKNPNKKAIVFEDTFITYSDLDKQSNQLAWYLIDKGIKNTDNISIIMNRSFNLIISILAVLKVGATYVLIDNSFPKDRIDYIIKDSNSKLCITNQNTDLNAEIININNIKCNNTKKILIKPSKNLSIIYTSGSTGTPKGVLLHNNGFVNLVYAFDKEMQISKYENILGIATVSFDMFAVELFSTLVFGNTLILANEEQQKNPIAMSELIKNNNVEFLITTPSKIELLLLKECNNPLETIKAFQLGGEKVTSKLFNRLSKATSAKIYNGYGPTEITACCSNKLITSVEDITIGKPISNMQIYICDENMNLLPIGTVGQICVSGIGVSNGYLNNEETTNKCFIKNPFGDGYLYKTGDLGKFKLNGEVEYIGRMDFQVKLRGLRIELGEIEEKISIIPNINNCIVIKKTDSNLSREFLCAYFTANKNINSTYVRKELEKTLPLYMIPQYILQIDKMPYTNNGKIDIKELAKLPISNINRQLVLPTNTVEKKLVKLLQQLLDNNNISMDNYFFDIGGDSLSAINLCVKIQSIFNAKISVKAIMDNPTIKEIANLIVKNSTIAENFLVKKVEKSDFYPVSSAQKRMYFVSKVAGENSTLYNSPSAVILEGNIDKIKLENCISTIINRHESLKTYFELVNENVVQKIDDNIDYKLDIIDSADFNEFDDYFKKFVNPFDLSKAPLFRTQFINFTNGKSTLFLDMHHIIFDGTSMSIFIDELCKLYNGEGLHDLKITYKDYANFENERIINGELDQAKEYWLKQFENEIPVLNLPTTFQRPAIQSFEGKKAYSIIDEETTNKLDNLAKNLGVTQYMLLLAAYYILLSKYCGQNDIIVGSPVVGRDLPETLNLIGMFVNTLALREKINNNYTFNEFVIKLKEHLLEAFEYQSYPFDKLITDLKIKRDTSRNPLFDTMFIYQSNNYTNIKINGVKAKYFVPDTSISKFDISLEAIPNYNKIDLCVEYSTKLFNEKFIEMFLMHYKNVINTILENNEIKISNISILSKEETEKILYSFNNTNIDYDKNKNIVKLFEEQAENTPKNTAVVFGEKSLTYEELNKKSNSLAYYLRNTKHIDKNDLVGIMLNRSLETLIAILGVLKAGGAYIPIDPSFPSDRINYMLENSKAKILLTQKHLAEKINYSNIICVDENNTIIYELPSENLNNINTPEDLMYIIFTSGSTGKPKGVMVTHKVFTNFTNYCNNYVEYLKNPQNDAIVSITTISFDIFAYETLISLQKGLKVVIANENEQITPYLLNALMEKNNVKIIQSTPSIMQIFLNNLDNMPALKELKYVILAGEQLPINIVDTLHNLSNIIVYNGYGPSETYYCTLTKIEKDFITIGKPIYNSQIYILDENLKPVPIGTTGEIYISGECVGKGYLNNDVLTKKSFIPNPFIDGVTMYKSGDLGKYLDDGNIICLGRSDHQIKIRGQRIEAEEIETLIQHYPNIKKVTIVKQSLENREFISAYLTVTKRINISELRQYLTRLLPRYMVPSYFIVLDDFPYTPNGKIDKKALPLPNELLNVDKEKYVAPKTTIQKQIVSIWEKVLNIAPIGITDNFFELGGDSILAMNLNIELQKKYSNITYSDIFRFPTITELEEKINSNNQKQYFSKIENLSDDYIDVLRNCTKSEKIKTWTPKNILLTGSTGFLGVHILEEFIKNSNGKIYCIIRDEPGLTAKTKIYQKLNYYFGNKYDDLIDKRIIPITGNIIKPGFGLNQEELLDLANSVDVIINCAARVSHFGNFDDFYNSNIKSVKYIIDFCNSFNKKLYHISTMGVSGKKVNPSLTKYKRIRKQNNTVVFDESSLYIGQELDNVYTRSKFEAENYVLDAISKGLDGYILRMGNLMPRYIDGFFQENLLENAFVNDLAAFIKLGCIPEFLLKLPLEFTPVDTVAKATYLLITNPTKNNRIFHLFNKNTVSVAKYLKLLTKVGYNVNILSEEDFKNRLKTVINSDIDKKSIGNLLNYLNNDLTIDYKTDIKIKSDFTVKYLKKIHFKWCKISNKYLIKFINLLRKVI